MNAETPVRATPTHRGANARPPLRSGIAWFVAAVGLALLAATLTPAQSSAVKPVAFTTSR